MTYGNATYFEINYCFFVIRIDELELRKDSKSLINIFLVFYLLKDLLDVCMRFLWAVLARVLR